MFERLFDDVLSDVSNMFIAVPAFSIVTDTTAKVSSGDQAGATARITDLETAWDDAEDRLRPLDGAAWTYLDGKIDAALKAVRASNPDPATEQQALSALNSALR